MTTEEAIMPNTQQNLCCQYLDCIYKAGDDMKLENDISIDMKYMDLKLHIKIKHGLLGAKDGRDEAERRHKEWVNFLVRDV